MSSLLAQRPNRSSGTLLPTLISYLFSGVLFALLSWQGILPWEFILAAVPLGAMISYAWVQISEQQQYRDRLEASLAEVAGVFSKNDSQEERVRVLLDALDQHPWVAGAVLFVPRRGVLSAVLAVGALQGFRALPRIADLPQLESLTEGEDLLHRRLLRQQYTREESRLLAMLEDASLDLLWCLRDERGISAVLAIREFLGADLSVSSTRRLLLGYTARYAAALRHEPIATVSRQLSAPQEAKVEERPAEDLQERGSARAEEAVVLPPTPEFAPEPVRETEEQHWDVRQRLARVEEGAVLVGAVARQRVRVPISLYTLPPIEALQEVIPGLESCLQTARKVLATQALLPVGRLDGGFARVVASALAQERGLVVIDLRRDEAPSGDAVYLCTEAPQEISARTESIWIYEGTPGLAMPTLASFDPVPLADLLLAHVSAGSLALSEEAKEQLRRTQWQGELEELWLQIARVPYQQESTPPTTEGLQETEISGDFHALVADFKRTLISKALVQAEGNRSTAASLLGLQRTYLYRLMKQLGVENNDDLQESI